MAEKSIKLTVSFLFCSVYQTVKMFPSFLSVTDYRLDIKQQHPSSRVFMPDDLASIFECSICCDYVLPPILQCANGHLICPSCRARVTICPTLAMERVAVNVRFPCKNSNLGCAAKLAYPEKTLHEEACEFRALPCPCPDGNCN